MLMIDDDDDNDDDQDGDSGDDSEDDMINRWMTHRWFTYIYK
jgi:hypothetical protein